MNSILKKLLYMILLILSPLALVVLLGVAYIIIQMINGIEPLAGVSSFIALLYSLVPYLAYLTTVPVIIFLLVLLLRNWRKSQKSNETP